MVRDLLIITMRLTTSRILKEQFQFANRVMIAQHSPHSSYYFDPRLCGT
jgi:hypothetical protein